MISRRLVALAVVAACVFGASGDEVTPTVPGLVTISGLVKGDGGSPADFAEITYDCKRPVCNAGADGAFRCRVALPESGAFCFHHPRLGRKRIVVETRSAAADLGTVQLVTGGTISIVRPLHVYLPDETTVSLLRDGKQSADPKPLADVVAFDGLESGRYALLLAGKEPLQRKLFDVELAEGGEAEIVLSVEPYRLTGEVTLRDEPLAGATVSLEGDAWQTELTADQSGRFDAELWAPGEYAVMVSAGDLEHPWAVMKRASPAESHWRLEVPWRRIAGRVYDLGSGKAIPNARVQIESESGETRATRLIDAREDGTFVYPGAGDGTYAVAASADGYARGERVEMKLRDGDADVQLNLPLVRGVDVTVTAVDARMQPIAQATVLVFDPPPGTSLTAVRRTGKDGSAVVSVPEGKAKLVYVVPADSSFGTATLTAGDARHGAVIAVPEGAATLRTMAKTRDHAPVPGIALALRYRGQTVPLPVLRAIAERRGEALVTGRNGELAITGLPAGPYELGWSPHAGGRAAAWTPVTLNAGETVVTQTFPAAADRK